MKVKVIHRSLTPTQILKKLSRINTGILMSNTPNIKRLAPYQLPTYVKEYYKELLAENN